MSDIMKRPMVRQAAGIVLIFLVYFLTARVSLGVGSINHSGLLFWPPSGLALGALFLFGYELWPGVLLAAFFANLSIGIPPPMALGIAAGYMLESLAGAYFLREHMKLNPLFSRLQDSLAFILTSFGSTVIATTAGSISLYLGGQVTQDSFAQTWMTWWVGDSLGVLIVGAFIIRWLCRPRFYKTLWEVVEGLVVFSSLIAVSVLIFWTPVSSIANIPLIYLLFIPLIWMALRTGPRGITLALLLISATATMSLFLNHGNVTLINGASDLLLLQIFIGTVAIIFLLFVSIVEERKEVMESLRDHISKLEEAVERVRAQDEAKNEFIATLGHELRNPLSPIISATELIRQNGVREEDAKLIDIIQSHTQTLARLLDDLLDISRITRKKFRLQKEVVELQSVVHRSQETVDAFLKTRGHALLVSMPQKPLWLSADKVRLEQIFVNLLFNAAKYTEPGGTITLTIAEAGDRCLRISVKDTGIGIDQEMLGRIFEPFVQANVPRGRVGSGLGIGLSLTKRLVELHGGTIRAESLGRGKGSEFIVELPISPNLQLQLPHAPAEVPTAREAGGLKYPKILVVDDNEAAAQGLGALLKHLGHEIEFAYDGTEALQQIQKFAPDVVLLDIGLPGMDGYQVARQVRQERGSSPVLIALSGYGQAEDKRKAREAGFNYHLTKPVGIRDLEQLLTS
ncbi:MAG: MASE1 domain-containing protein [Patescibacteria group bacterium]|nr:MASE1 domain-containing protein [Patescibacteria group bacterium]